MAITMAHILNEQISYASVAHAELKTVFDKFKKILKKFDETGIITIESQSSDKTEITISFTDRLYEFRFTSGYVEDTFSGKIAAWRKQHDGYTEVSSVSFDSRKARITDPMTKVEGSLHEAHFVRILVYGWLLKDIGWNIDQLDKLLQQKAEVGKEDTAEVEAENAAETDEKSEEA